MIYALTLSPDERARYRLMAEVARTEEAIHMIAAGLRPGAAVADIGCGPGATLLLLAQDVGSQGRTDGVDQARPPWPPPRTRSAAFRKRRRAPGTPPTPGCPQAPMTW